MRIARYLYSALLFFAVSCEWEPIGIHELNISPTPLPPEIEVRGFSFDFHTESAVLLSDVIYFDFQSSGPEIISVEFFLNDHSLGTEYRPKGLFKLHRMDGDGNLYEGLHQLHIKVYTRSGSGSIADQMGAEGYGFTSPRWLIRVKENPSINMTLMLSDGYLKLRWINDENENYVVMRNGQEIGRTTGDTFTDKSYVGQGAHYTLSIGEPAQGFSGYGSALLNKSIPELKFSYSQTGQYYLHWEKPFFHSAIDSVYLIKRNNFEPYKIAARSGNINDTVYEIQNAVFAENNYYNLMLRPKENHPDFNPASIYNTWFQSYEISALMGIPSFSFSGLYNISATEFLYHTHIYHDPNLSENDSVFRFSSSANRITGRFGMPVSSSFNGINLWNLTASPNGHFVAAHYRMGSRKVFLAPVNQLANYKLIDISHLNPLYSPIPLADNGTGLIFSFDVIYLYDLVSEQVLAQLNSNISWDNTGISPDGKYFFLQSHVELRIYRLENNAIKQHTFLSAYDANYYNYFAFHPENPDQFVGWDKTKKIFYHGNINNMAVTTSFSLPDEKIHHIDFFNNKILSSDKDIYRIRNLNNGQLLHEVPSTKDVLWSTEVFLHNHTLYHRNGIKHILE